MTRKLLGMTGIVVVLSSIVYLARPVGHIPPYDANLVRLAETPLEAYCAGDIFWKTQGVGDRDMAEDCRRQRASSLSDVPDLSKVERAFCQAIVDNGWDHSVDDCLSIIRQYTYWPTYDGGLSNDWNRARPYPRPVVTSDSVEDNSRTGVRRGPSRDPNSRDDTATESTTPSASPSPSPSPSPSNSSSEGGY